jgi:hypothetical protein
MALPPSGPITMGMINVELNYPATQVISLNDAAVRALAQVPAGMISLSNFYGKSNSIQKGFWLNGQRFTPPTVSSVGASSIDFPTQTISVIGNVPENRYIAAGGMKSTSTLYVGGGIASTPTAPGYSNFLKFNISSQSYATGGNTPAIFSGIPSSFASSPVAGYATTIPQLAAAPTGSVHKYLFSTDAYSLLGPARVPVMLGNRVGQANNLNAYYFGGRSATPPNPANSGTNQITRFPFSTETGTLLGNVLPSPRAGSTTSSSPTNAYLFSNFVSPGLTAVTFSYSNETASNISNQPVQRNYASSVSNGSNCWLKGGQNPPSASVPTYSVLSYQKYEFSTGTYTTTGNVIADNTSYHQWGGQPLSVSY